MIHARKDYQELFPDPTGKIPEDEPVILFRAQDVLFLQVLASYREGLMSIHADPEIVACIDAHFQLARKWRSANRDKVKIPDLPREPASGA